MSDAITQSNTGIPAVSAQGESWQMQQKRSGRLGVNAAFLQEIKDDNRQLKTDWDRLVPMLAHPETALNHWNEIVAALAELRDQLAIHFSLEEAYGYFDDAIDVAPHLSVEAESLKGQHTALFAQIRDLADQFAEADLKRDGQVEKLLRKFDAFQAEFQTHEESELKLILDSFGDDIGVGD
ncbi:hemerythrin domain-containing protein [Roseiconus lacunae]|uniref:Hemerythrin domain-containing protein n=1 Tax=Roseiconus lacunae TaxID=2605694 RepID=A0ABT7PN78_9BACT|nr:hemerythrin domain-containing protein [Roseiconus lacunae]MCD0463381.1 hemerythrin domain-containing protein [Roseiconus lacunae]MDM4017741.1 hemerythrin domain-containing protein [Roseiconus lacunae]